MLVSRFVPQDPFLDLSPSGGGLQDQGKETTIEVMNDRVMQFSNGEITCLSSGRYSLQCDCSSLTK